MTKDEANKVEAVESRLEQEVLTLRQEVERLTAERDKRDIEAVLYCAKWEDAQATLARVEGELKQSVEDNFSLVEQLHRADARCTESFTSRCDHCGTDSTFLIAADTEREDRLRERLAQAAQREARLMAALNAVLFDVHQNGGILPTTAHRYAKELGYDQAQQAISLSTDQSQPTGSDHSETPS